jgi:hypothetical protein
MTASTTRFFDLTAPGKFRRILLATLGGTVLLVGIVLLVLPGPAFLVIPAGLGILALEFAWARRWLRAARNFVQSKRGAGGLISCPNARPSVRARLKLQAGLVIRAGELVVATALLVLAGAIYVVIPALAGIVAIEYDRLRRCLGSARQFLMRTRLQ